MRFQCPQCLGIVGIDDSDAGQAVACGHCGRPVVVPASRLSAGAVINDFVIQKELGKGGMGMVYLARQLSLERPVALKILHPRLAEDQEFVTDFIREARAAAQLNHPNIVQAYAVGEEEGVFFFAMEYVEGTTLKQLLSHSGRIVVDRALSIAGEITEALKFAWINQKLIHRDIKPDNIILTDTGRIKLSDLGLARRVSDLLNERTDEVMGTPQYIAPEALVQKPLDHRSDMYSLGATLYHTVTGRFPYQGDSASEIARKHLSEPLVPPRVAVPDIPEAVSKLVEIMMAKRPEHRYADYAELERDLELVKRGEMPKHPLHSDSQKPIPLERAAGSVPGMTTAGKRLVFSSARPRSAATGAAGAPAADGAAPEGEAGAPTAPPPRKGLSTKAMIWGFASLVVVSLVIVLTLVVFVIRDKNKKPEEKELDRLRKAFPTEFPYLLSVRQALREGRNPEDVLAIVKAYQAAAPDSVKTKTELSRKILAMTADCVEQELAALRKNRKAEEMKDWQARARELQAKAAADAEVIAKAKQDADKVQRELEEKQRLEKIHADLVAQLTQQQQTIRAEALTLGMKSQFGEGRLQFVGMQESREAAFREWAKNMVRCFELADKLYSTISGSKTALGGEKVGIPGKPGRWTIISVSSREIVIEKNDIDVKTGGVVKRTENVLLTEFSPMALVELASKMWHKLGLKDNEFNVMAGAYLLARGDVTTFAEARRRLGLSGMTDEVAPLVAELDVVEPIAKEKAFGDELAALRLLSNSGKTREAALKAQAMRAQFPDLYQKSADEIAKLLSGN